mmetsp:Transcript_17537/g.27112  ORF Transcript_17537/g.27112 Transcript_17537/m.27112 type:complete len:211 (+) Transcript_17537:16-648(+)
MPARKNTSYSTYIYKVLKQVHPEMGISKFAMQVMGDYNSDTLYRITEEAREICMKDNKATLSSREIQTAVRLVLPGELSKHAVSEGTKAVTKFSSNQGSKGSQSVKAGLVFPVGRVKKYLKERTKLRIGAGSAIYLAAVLEYMVAELLELSGNCARDNQKKRIIPRHVQLALRNDEELNKHTRDVCLMQGGVIPHIHYALLPPKTKKLDF